MKAEAPTRGAPTAKDRHHQEANLLAPQYRGRRTPDTAFAEVHITQGMLSGGLLTERALRQIRHDVYGIPAAARVVVHLGPLREPDELLIRFLAELPCSISFGGNWRVATAAQQMVTELRAEVS